MFSSSSYYFSLFILLAAYGVYSSKKNAVMKAAKICNVFTLNEWGTPLEESFYHEVLSYFLPFVFLKMQKKHFPFSLIGGINLYTGIMNQQKLSHNIALLNSIISI